MRNFQPTNNKKLISYCCLFIAKYVKNITTLEPKIICFLSHDWLFKMRNFQPTNNKKLISRRSGETLPNWRMCLIISGDGRISGESDIAGTQEIRQTDMNNNDAYVDKADDSSVQEFLWKVWRGSSKVSCAVNGQFLVGAFWWWVRKIFHRKNYQKYIRLIQSNVFSDCSKPWIWIARGPNLHPIYPKSDTWRHFNKIKP